MEGLIKFVSFLQKNRTIDWNVVTAHRCKPRQQGLIYLLVCSSFHSLSFQWWVMKSFEGFFFVYLPSSNSTTRNTELVCNTFIRSTLSSSFNASYFTFKVTSWCFLFVAIFVASATNNRIETNLKISKHSNIIANLLSRISKDGKTRLRNQNSNYMMKKVQVTRKFVRFRWFFELCEFELKEFSCKGLLVNSEGTKEFVRLRWSFELRQFVLHEFTVGL